MASEVGFAEDDLLTLAGSRSFERGLGYLDAVTGLEIGDGWITATVHGTDAYEVELTDDQEGGLLGDCDCPYGQEGHFCKHCVAVGLTVLRQADTIPQQRAAASTRTAGLEDWLQSLTREELLALLREQIAGDRDLRRRLELRAASVRSDIAVVRERVMALLDVRAFARYGYVEYEDAGAYAHQAAEAVDALRSLAAAGRAGEAVTLAREAMRVLSQTYEEIDDSDGVVGSVGADLADAHLQACTAAKPDPVETAEWLVGHLLSDLNDITDIDLVDYRKVLGPTGLARARELATAARRRAPNDWAAKYLMERLAKAEGNVDALVAVYAADLAPSGATHLQIALELDEAGREAEALEWAERGLRDTEQTVNVHSGLDDYVCTRYTQMGRTAEVVAVRRSRFRAVRSLSAYQALRAAAEAAGCWKAEREAALEALRTDVSEHRSGWYGGPVLVDALLDDGDLNAAWQAAQGCADERQWLSLADRSKDTRPADALPVYLRLVEPLKKKTGDRTYQQLARLLLAARACHQHLGTEVEFAGYLSALRADQKRKRNLMKILDQHGL
ncbi:SWIM zinc finger domain-containing protein [Streptomyces violascens]|uniref:SWIM zinc finger domain-containing protein n=1 Tax=Streptomyces violascens TaxID=67381 RepID=UPI0037B2D965